MPAKKAPDTSRAKKTASKSNKAKIAFGEYKKRMESSGTTKGMGAGFNPAQSFDPSYYGGAPPWPYPPPSAAMPIPPYPQDPRQGMTDQFRGSGKSLFESIGNMLAIGVDLLSAGMQGSRQILEGFIGVGYGLERSPGPGHHHYHAEDCCCEMCYPHYDCCDCCYESCCDCECCNPGVHNCC